MYLSFAAELAEPPREFLQYPYCYGGPKPETALVSCCFFRLQYLPYQFMLVSCLDAGTYMVARHAKPAFPGVNRNSTSTALGAKLLDSELLQFGI
jgi:hypothetical protein